MKTSHKRIWSSLRALLVGAALFAPSVSMDGQEVPTVLGQDGTVFRLYQGTYGDLFGEGTEADSESPVLALDIRHGDGSSSRLLVPGSETAAKESSASMIFEDSAGIVYLVWETLFNGQHPLLQLTSFDGAEWSELIEITSNIFANKGALQLVVQRENARAIVGGLENKPRTTLHLSWREESVGVSRKVHSPIIFEEGQYLGWAPIIDLSGYVLVDDTSAPPEVPDLENALSLQMGTNRHRVVAGFINPQTHRLVTLEIETLSQTISNIADAVRAGIVVIGLTANTHAELAEMAQAEVLAQGTAFHEAARRHLADQVRLIVEESQEDLTPAGIISISESVRAGIVVIGSRIGPFGLANPRNTEIIAVGESATSDEPKHYFQITVVSDREAPEVGGPAELMLSESGQNVIVTWEEEGHVFYRESLEEGWSEPSSIELTEDLDREMIFQMLSDRVRAD